MMPSEALATVHSLTTPLQIANNVGTSYIFANSDVQAIVADPSARNLRSVRAFLKADFKIINTVQLAEEGFERHVVRLGRIAE